MAVLEHKLLPENQRQVSPFGLETTLRKNIGLWQIL
jgi:hypothetical protein